jgi:hypothetical protein
MSDFAIAALRERKKGAGLRVLEPEFCTSTDTGRILVTVLGMEAKSRMWRPVSISSPEPKPRITLYLPLAG